MSPPFRWSANFSPQREVIFLARLPCRFFIHPPIHPLHDALFIEPTSSHKNSPSLSSFRSRPRRILSDSRSSLNSLSSSSFYSASFCSLGEYVSRPLLRETFFFIFAFLWVCYDLPAIEYAAMPLLQKKPLIDFVYALSVFDLVSIPRSRNQLFPQSYDSCFQFRSVPSPLPFFSVVSTLYSSRYLPPRLLYNIVDTLFNPSLRLTSVFPAFSSAISSIFYQLAFVNVPSYSVPITFNLFPTRLFSSHPPSLARILANSR